jgi:hypothetical protein
VLEERAGWMRVAVPGKNIKGWMHGSALSSKRIVLQAGAEDVQRAATTGEIALAGKGFNEQVEREFRAQNKDVDFAGSTGCSFNQRVHGSRSSDLPRTDS